MARPISWGILYLLSIIVFAIIYAYGFHLEFQHSGPPSNPEYRTEITKKLRQYSGQITKHYEALGGEVSLIEFTSISPLYEFEGYQLETEFEGDDFSGRYLIEGTLATSIVNFPDYKFEIEFLATRGVVPFPFYLRSFIKSDGDSSPISKEVKNRFLQTVGHTPIEVDEEMVSLLHQLEGRIASGHTALWRMLYFSAVTTTTLGYGDITPITTRARMVVTAQTILGVVLIDMFLNSLFSTSPKTLTKPSN